MAGEGGGAEPAADRLPGREFSRLCTERMRALAGPRPPPPRPASDRASASASAIWAASSCPSGTDAAAPRSPSDRASRRRGAHDRQPNSRTTRRPSPAGARAAPWPSWRMCRARGSAGRAGRRWRARRPVRARASRAASGTLRPSEGRGPDAGHGLHHADVAQQAAHVPARVTQAALDGVQPEGLRMRGTTPGAGTKRSATAKASSAPRPRERVVLRNTARKALAQRPMCLKRCSMAAAAATPAGGGASAGHRAPPRLHHRAGGKRQQEAAGRREERAQVEGRAPALAPSPAARERPENAPYGLRHVRREELRRGRPPAAVAAAPAGREPRARPPPPAPAEPPSACLKDSQTAGDE